MPGLSIFDYIVVVLYILLTLGIVFWSSRKQKGTEDFFLGGRRLPWLAVGLSIMATLLSSMTYLGLTGEVVKNGVAAYAMQLAVIPAALIVIPIFIPFFTRLRFTSAYEYLEHRFDYRTRLLGSALFLLLRVGWVSMVMYTGSLALAEMTGWNLLAVVFVLGVAATLYTCFGGLTAVVWTDVVQALMLFGGAAAIVIYVWVDTGDGLLTWWQAAGEHSKAHTQPEWFSFDPRTRMTLGTALIAGFFWQICTHCSDQVVLQRYASTPSPRAARNSYITNVASALSIATLLGVSGLALLYFYLQHPERMPGDLTLMNAGDKLMPRFYARELPLGFGGLILANFICDAMQSLVSGVNSVTAVASQEVAGTLRVPSAGAANNDESTSKPTPSAARSQLFTARILTLVLGLATTGIALGVAYLASTSGKNIIDLMPRTFNMFLGPLGALFLIGMFIRRAGARSATIAVLSALVLAIGWCYFKEIFGGLFEKPFDLSISWAIALPCLWGLSVAFLLSRFEPSRPRPGDQFTWRAVTSREK